MTRAMDTLILTRAQYRRRYGNDAPEASIPSRFLEEVPGRLIEDLGSRLGSGRGGRTGEYGGGRTGGFGSNHRMGLAAGADFEGGHYSYEDEDQTASGQVPGRAPAGGAGLRATAYPSARPAVWPPHRKPAAGPGEKTPDSIDNIAQFFAGRPGAQGRFSRPKLEIATKPAPAGLTKGSRVRHGKYGEGTVILREGDGEDAKLTVHFARFGVKKLMEQFAQLEKL
jgi:DNA helicase-2/ATP-dependent DNA helicase PcrA